MPPMPERIAKLPVQRGYPVPWFVAMVDGEYDFRVIESGRIAEAHNNKLCWVCGEKLGATFAFPIGPMCAINRVISEPPSHRECVEWSMKACPFLTQQQVRRNEKNMPEGCVDAAGMGLKRQPGVVCLWLTRSYKPFRPHAGNDGVLFKLGDPEAVYWWREGRAATRAEVIESIESGFPTLEELAVQQGSIAIQVLKESKERAWHLLPPAEIPEKKMLGSAARR